MNLTKTHEGVVEEINKLKEFNEFLDEMTELGFSVDGKILSSFYSLYEFAIKLFKCSYEDRKDITDWFIFENGYGKEGKYIDIEGDNILLNNVSEFAKAILRTGQIL